jgi:hypothetical protein
LKTEGGGVFGYIQRVTYLILHETHLPETMFKKMIILHGLKEIFT